MVRACIPLVLGQETPGSRAIQPLIDHICSGPTKRMAARELAGHERAIMLVGPEQISGFTDNLLSHKLQGAVATTVIEIQAYNATRSPTHRI